MKIIFIQKDNVDTTAWGHHLTLDCKACDKKAITNRDTIIAFVKELCQKIKMKPYGAPTVEHFGGHDVKVAGHSLVQLIETSAIMGHFVDHTHAAYLDIFTCSHLDVEAALKTVQHYFKPEAVNVRLLNRKVPE